jgi:hypothetical protein
LPARHRAAGTFLPSGRGVYRDQSNETFVNQSDLRVVTETARCATRWSSADR